MCNKTCREVRLNTDSYFLITLPSSTMSSRKEIFSKQGDKQSRIVDALKKLRETEQMLREENGLLEKKMEEEMSDVIRLRTEHKTAAIEASKIKNLYEDKLQKNYESLLVIVTKREDLEEANRNAVVLETLKIASDALKAAQQHKTLDQIRDLMRDEAEQQKVAKEFSEAISKLAASGEVVDKNKAEREVEEILQEELERKLLGLRLSIDEL